MTSRVLSRGNCRGGRRVAGRLRQAASSSSDLSNVILGLVPRIEFDDNPGVSERYPCIAVYMTSNLPQRAYHHREGLVEGFTSTHGCKMLVWYEQHETMLAAIAREKAIKHYVRVWKLNLIERMNPQWRDLYPELV